MKTLNKNFLTALAVGLLGCSVFAGHAHASYINGGIVFSGSGSVTTSAGVTTLAYDSSGPGAQTVSSTFANNGGNAYGGIAVGTAVSFSSFSFDDIGADLTLVNPVNPFWSLTSGGTWTFTLTSLTSNTFASSPNNFIIHGNGYATGPGYNTTAATYAINAIYHSTTNTYDYSLTDYTIGTNVGVPDGGE